MDTVDRERRHAVMARVRTSGTEPELRVRSIVRSLGIAYRLNVKKLPGKPDIAFPRLKKAILVHGCFWHQHPGCPAAKRPSTNIEFWNAKLDENIARDIRKYENLGAQGWSHLIIWECQIKDEARLLTIITDFLSK
jgi:DNA mismatch endonuclease, patch repair protein